MTRESGESTRLRVLLIEDNATDAQRCVRKLPGAGFEVSADVVGISGKFRKFVSSGTYDVILSECRIPDWTGLEDRQQKERRA